jgi:DMSO/TMAO reductase YedYZ molybdopterin-dependent catalytic subunit
LDLGIQPDIPLKEWTLEVRGEVKNPFTLNWKEFLALPQIKDISDFHCVTTWSRMDNHWEGVQFKTIADKAQLKPSAKFVFITGYDGYSTNLTLEECLDPDVLLVHMWEGKPLPREHGGPMRMITPRKYAWKGSKWVKEIIFLSEEKMGFWELRGYSNTAEPWQEDRYS